ncbi:9319_t:CDS:2, partial [Paraglomus occultum]
MVTKIGEFAMIYHTTENQAPSKFEEEKIINTEVHGEAELYVQKSKFALSKLLDRNKFATSLPCLLFQYLLVAIRSPSVQSPRSTPSSTSDTPPASALSVFYSTFTSPDPDLLFGNIFEELLRPEVDTPHWFYAPIGTVAGGILGFIIGNLPGLILGAYLGGKLGGIRDAK